MINHAFRLIFPSPELRKCMIGGKNPNTFKTISFGGFKNLSMMIKYVTLNKRL
jgi:hypothetical protein